MFRHYIPNPFCIFGNNYFTFHLDGYQRGSFIYGKEKGKYAGCLARNFSFLCSHFGVNLWVLCSQSGVNLWFLWVIVSRASRLAMATSKLKQSSHTAMAIAKELSIGGKKLKWWREEWLWLCLYSFLLK